MEDQNLFQPSLGGRIKARRKLAGLTLEDLADKTGLTASFISQVERGKANVSLNSLQIIAVALGIPVLYFVGDPPAQLSPQSEGASNSLPPVAKTKELFNPVVLPNTRSRLVLPNSGIELELLVPNIGRKMISFKARLAPKITHVASHHKEPTEEILYVLSGTITLEFTDATFQLHPEETIYFEGHNLVRIINPSEFQDAIWISTITPGIF